jgi:hypothetical protein
VGRVLEEQRRRKSETVERTPLRTPAALLREVGAKNGQVPVPREKLAAAATAWMLLVFALCYVAIPLGIEAAHLRDAQMFLLPADIRGLGVVWAMLMGFIALVRPQVRLDGRIDPILSATAGGFFVWALLHNVLPFLTPFVQMPLDFLVAFVLANVLESGLFGAMLASLVPSRRAAFLLGALFQIVFMGGAYLFVFAG